MLRITIIPIELYTNTARTVSVNSIQSQQSIYCTQLQENFEISETSDTLDITEDITDNLKNINYEIQEVIKDDYQRYLHAEYSPTNNVIEVNCYIISIQPPIS